MALPKLKSVLFDAILPVSKQKIKYRPYTIKEEKILIIALKSDEASASVEAVKQVINNCVVTKGFDVEKIHTFDLEYLLVRLRIVSVSDVLELSFKDDEDGNTYPVAIKLPEVIEEIVSNTEVPDKVIMLNETVGVEMKDITIDMIMSDELDGINDPMRIYTVLPKLISHVFDDDQIYKFEDAEQEEVEEFFDSFDKTATKRIGEYFEKIPRLYYEISYTNSKGTIRKIELNGLADFFQFS